MKKKRGLLLAITGLMTAAVLSLCGGNGQKAEESSQGTAAGKTEIKSGQRIVMMRHLSRKNRCLQSE